MQKHQGISHFALGEMKSVLLFHESPRALDSRVMNVPAAPGSSYSSWALCALLQPEGRSRAGSVQKLCRSAPNSPCIAASSLGPGNGCKGKSHTGSGRKSRLMKTVQTMKSYGNYQNCTIVRPHIPHSSYGTYVTLAPKVLVFPVFVQVSMAARDVVWI